ncbi:amino acid adenylation domain-containing protein [Kitasatospora sp. NPDC101235]|uniref:non-ribosomal peptide synthetase n=1 Tax=Kitasatospora sp. NPDC101235 TaxID=3364101 RepID=UPI00381794CF
MPPAFDGIHEAVGHWARITPDAVAVSWRGRHLSYCALERRAERLAQLLWEAGVRPGQPVGILLDPSPDRVVVLLAALKCGAYYVALDTRVPPARRRDLLDLAGAEVLVTDGEEDLGRRVVHPASPPPAGAPEHQERRRRAATHPESAAYICFTSGTSGVPKGVVVPHRAVLHLVADPDGAGAGREDVVVHASSLAFDASTFEVWAPLVNGGRLVLPDDTDRTPAALERVVAGEGATVLWLTAGLFHRFSAGELADLRGLRRLLAGGDVVAPEQVNRAVSVLPGTRVINGYGPTENTTFTCLHPVTAPVTGPGVPIGTALPGAATRVVDADLRAVPDGRTGELLAWGPGVARGYLGDARLTAERFVPAPGASGGRAYRTGDAVRDRGDGVLEFEGRMDRQVKIRGFRVEPAEVEAVLARLPGVGEAAVVAPRRSDGERVLTAFVVYDDPFAEGLLTLRRELARHLPGYALPAAVRVVDALPLTVGGKVDRAALEAWPPSSRRKVGAPYTAPVTDVEKLLAGLWADLFGLAEVGTDDDFFELGGDSLLGMRLAGEVHDAFGVDVPARRFYATPTVAVLARLLEEGAGPAGAPG